MLPIPAVAFKVLFFAVKELRENEREVVGGKHWKIRETKDQMFRSTFFNLHAQFSAFSLLLFRPHCFYNLIAFQRFRFENEVPLAQWSKSHLDNDALQNFVSSIKNNFSKINESDVDRILIL